MPRKKIPPVTEAQRAARRQNIVEFNASRNQPPAQKHGCQSSEIKNGKLPKGFEDLQGVIDSFYEGWISDAGGRENITKSKEALLWVARGCLAVFAVGLEHVKAKGLVDPEGGIQPVLKILGTYGNTMRLNLVAAGLERTPRNVTRTLEATLQEIAEKEHKDEPVADESL
jgi:hypothetical protein